MNPILNVYLICTLVCIALNHKFYQKTTLKDGYERIYGLITYALLVFCGPLSLILTIYCNIKNHFRKKRIKKELLELIEEQLLKACAENNIKIVDRKE